MNEIKKILIKESDIKRKVKEVADTVTADYAGEKLLAVCVLRGASIFFADLVREINLDLELDFISASSYGSGTSSSGEVKMIKDLSEPIAGKNVLIVEDIVDTGITLSYLKKIFATRNPKSLRICTLLDKPSRRRTELVPEYRCFEIPNEFVVGYGLDYNERFRALKDVCVINEDAVK